MPKTETKQGLSRREFMKGTVVGAGVAALAGAGLGGKTAKAAQPPEKWDKEADLVIVGYGGAAAAAAIEAAQAGAKVLILEKAPIPGGATAVCGGIVYGAGTSVQKAVGVQDSAAEMYKFWMACGGDLVNPDFVKLVSENSGPNIEWLINLGCRFPEQRLYVSGAEGIEPYASVTPPKMRGHRQDGGGAALFKVLSDAVKATGAEVLLETSAKQLVANPTTKEVLGVKAESGTKTLYIRAKRAVLLASGGCVGNKEMLKAYSFEEGYKDVRSAPPQLTGDGILMAQALGADTLGLEQICSLPAVRIPAGNLDNRVGFTTPIILVNGRGMRFCNETVHYDVVTYAISKQDKAFAIFDAARKALGGKTIATVLSSDLAKEIKDGLVIEADSIGELAAKLGMKQKSSWSSSWTALQETVRNWNTYSEWKSDPEFGRSTAFGPIKTPPFYAIEITGGIVETTGGLRTNLKFQVLDVFGKIIPRLYAIGPGIVGGIVGPIYPGSGTAIAIAICSGRIAGRNSAAEKPLG